MGKPPMAEFAGFVDCAAVWLRGIVKSLMPQTVAVIITSAVVVIKAIRVSFCIASGCRMVLSFHQTPVRVRHAHRFSQRLPLPAQLLARRAFDPRLGAGSLVLTDPLASSPSLP